MSILVLTSDTLIATAAAGNIEYNGQFFGTDSNASRAQIQRLVLSTAQNSTSGTSIDFTALPSWVKRITVMMNGISTNGTSNVQIQIGSGSVTTSGYSSSASFITSGVGSATSTTGFIVTPSVASATVSSGNIMLCLISNNAWTYSGLLSLATGTQLSAGVSASLGGILDRVRITTVNGTDTFDAGSVNILYEG
jgi:hypothetical protein